jgi:hypothetical protein
MLDILTGHGKLQGIKMDLEGNGHLGICIEVELLRKNTIKYESKILHIQEGDL